MRPVKDRLAQFSQSNLIYQFQCECGVTYIGRTERRLRTRAREHVPVWVQRRTACMHEGAMDGHTESIDSERMPASAVGQHVLTVGHTVDLLSAFRIIYRAQNKRLLQFIEALAIRRKKPVLCRQKDSFVSLSLPW